MLLLLAVLLESFPLGGRLHKLSQRTSRGLGRKQAVAQRKEANPEIQKHADAMRHGMAHSASNAAATRTTAREADQNIDQVGDAICGQGASRMAKCRACHYGEDHLSDRARCPGMNGSAERHVDTEQAHADHQPATTDVQNQKQRLRAGGTAAAALINSKKRFRGPNSISERGCSEGIPSGSRAD